MSRLFKVDKKKKKTSTRRYFLYALKMQKRKGLRGQGDHPSRDGLFSESVVFYSTASFYAEAGEDSWMEIKSGYIWFHLLLSI